MVVTHNVFKIIPRSLLIVDALSVSVSTSCLFFAGLTPQMSFLVVAEVNVFVENVFVDQ